MAAVREQVRALLVETAGERGLPANAGLQEAGLDSVEILEFFAELEHQLGFRFQPGDLDLAALNSVDEIARLVEARLQKY